MSSTSHTTVEEKPLAPFVLSLIAGIFILLGAIVMSMFAFGMPNMMGGMGGSASAMSGMMSNMYGGFGMGRIIGLAPTFTIVGLVSSTVVVLGSVMLYTRPSANQLWGSHSDFLSRQCVRWDGRLPSRTYARRRRWRTRVDVETPLN